MATITSHLLNGMDGTHAAGVSVILRDLSTGRVVIETSTNQKGRFEVQLGPGKVDAASTCELVFLTADYWNRQGISGPDLIGEIVLRFSMPDADGHYHSPIILSPNSYSTWKSSRDASIQ